VLLTDEVVSRGRSSATLAPIAGAMIPKLRRAGRTEHFGLQPWEICGGDYLLAADLQRA
jgi:hypothetical protein